MTDITSTSASEATPQRVTRNIYIAGRFRRRDQFRIYSQELIADGHIITSRWLYAGEQQSDAHTIPPDLRLKYALEDYADLQAADTVLVFTEEEDSPYSHGGRHVELGKEIFIVGPRENVFCHLHDIHHHAEWSPTIRRELSAANKRPA